MSVFLLIALFSVSLGGETAPSFRVGLELPSPVPVTPAVENAIRDMDIGFVNFYVSNTPAQDIPETETVAAISEPRMVEIRLRIDLGEDAGQNFGTLFEARTRDNAFVFGAGFLGLYNTHYREDRHTVHFFARPAAGGPSFTIECLPRPNDLAGVYLFSHDGRTYAAGPDMRVWNENESRWLVDDPAPGGRMRVGNDHMAFHDGRVECNGKVVLDAPDQGTYYRFYYAQGRLFFYHTYWAGQEGYRPYAGDAAGFTKLYVCPWRPADGTRVDLAHAVIETLPFVGETPFAYGQLGHDVLTCSNIGGLYAFDGERWRTVIRGGLETSYQIYSMLSFEDRLLMGQYPTGELFSFDGATVTRLKGSPPRMPGVSASAREAQTTTLYGGELYVGVWPWGELWRYHPDTRRWTLARRMFTHPPATAETTHPYETECAALGVVANQWGQRVTSLVVAGPSLFVSTSAKAPCLWEPRFDFLGDGLWKEYGAVYRLTAPGHVSARLDWTSGPTVLSFVVTQETLEIRQDGKTLARSELRGEVSGAARSALELEEPVWGKGLYGPFGGLSIEGETRIVPASGSMP